MKTVTAKTRTTLLLDYTYFPMRILRARDVFTSMMRKRLKYDEVVKALPFSVIDIEGNQVDSKTWLQNKDTYLATGNYPLLPTAQHVYPVPSILRVNTIYKKPKHFKELRKPSFEKLLKKHDYTCAITGERFDPAVYNPYEVFNKDHVLPRALSGPDTEDNIVLTTKEANTKKGHQYPYYDHKGQELKAVIQNDYFPDLNLRGVEYRKEWGPYMFKDLTES